MLISRNEAAEGSSSRRIENAQKAHRILEDDSYDARIISVVLLILAVSVGFYATSGYSFPTFLAVLVFFWSSLGVYATFTLSPRIYTAWFTGYVLLVLTFLVYGVAYLSATKMRSQAETRCSYTRLLEIYGGSAHRCENAVASQLIGEVILVLALCLLLSISVGKVIWTLLRSIRHYNLLLLQEPPDDDEYGPLDREISLQPPACISASATSYSDLKGHQSSASSRRISP